LGGGGPVHAAALARELGMRRVIVPLHPGVLSASGLLAAPVEHEAATAFHGLLDKATKAVLVREFSELDRQCAELMRVEGIAADAVDVQYYADVCYVGQSYHLEIPVSLDDGDVVARVRKDFFAAHDRIYGHSTEGAVKFVNLRTVHQARASTVADEAYVAEDGDPRKGARPILTEKSGGFVEAQVYERRRIKPGVTFYGPAIVEQADTTTVIEPGWRAEVDTRGNLVMTQGELK